MTSIVTVNVSQNVAPTPSTLQQTGAFLSQGATTTASGTLTLLTQYSDLTPILTGAKAISAITWASSIATVTTTSPHGFTNGDTLELTITGCTPAGYNGTVLCTITGASTFTYPLVSNPGSLTVPGVYTPEDVAELVAMATTFFAQGAQTSVYVLELGPGNPTDGVATLTSWIAANPSTVYAYLVPRLWDGNSNFLALIQSFESTTAKTYFFVTTTTGTYSSYTSLMKDVIALIEAPSIPATEFTNAGPFWRWLTYNPSNTNKVAPFAFSYMFGVTPYPTKGNAALLATLKAANINVIGTGAEGGISNAILLWGTTMDGRDATYWYSVDWMQIQSDLALSNAIINGSNNPINPLYCNQDGINVLQGVLGRVVQNAISFGLATGTLALTELDGQTLSVNLNTGVYAGDAVVNAVPFVIYYTANPGDYKVGKYAGLSVIYVPARGFISIVLNINVTDFITQ